MKTLISLVMLLTSLNSIAVFDDHSIKGKVDIEGFTVGSDADLGGGFNYIVDRTTGLCFASMSATSNGRGSALTTVPCEALKKIKKIKKYIETGKTD